jgi:hypothetical protein
MSKTREYIALISKGDMNYANTGIRAIADADALRQARDWAAKQSHWEGASVTVSLDGRSVGTIKPGDF